MTAKRDKQECEYTRITKEIEQRHLAATCSRERAPGVLGIQQWVWNI
jgi:hypothetical protein